VNHLVKIGTENCQTYLGQIIEIEKLSFQSPWSINAFQSELKNPVSNLWALTSDNILLGYVCFWMFDSEIQIINIAVHPHKRGQRLGYHLLTAIIETSISHGMRNIWLEVRPSNLAAMRLYRKFGFQEVGRRPRYYTDTNEDAILMALELSQKESRHMASN
jgi:ribosomal-protein-alanine N-acetyltransferase